MTPLPQYRDLSGLSKLLKFCLIVYIAIALASIWSGWLEFSLLQRAERGANFTDEEVSANDLRQQAIGILQLVGFIITGIIFLRWKYLSNRNARSFGVVGMEFTPGWSVGWYFIPIASLWKPFQAMREMFKASNPDGAEAWHNAPHPGILPLWWALWIISNFSGQIAMRTAVRAESIAQLKASNAAAFVSDLIDVPLGIVAIAVVAKLTTWQSEKHDRLAADDSTQFEEDDITFE
jgi:hypothetical protein